MTCLAFDTRPNWIHFVGKYRVAHCKHGTCVPRPKSGGFNGADVLLSGVFKYLWFRNGRPTPELTCFSIIEWEQVGRQVSIRLAERQACSYYCSDVLWAVFLKRFRV